MLLYLTGEDLCTLKLIRNGSLFLAVLIRSPEFLAMPLSLIRFQGKKHSKLRLGLHGDQESPVIPAW